MIPNILYSIIRRNTNDQNNDQNNPNNNLNNDPNNNLNNNPEHNIGYGGTQIITPQPPLTGQSPLSNVRFGAPVCILRAPSDMNIPPTTTTSSTQTDDNSSEQQPLSAFILPPNIPGSTSREPVAETAKINDETSGGIFGKCFSLHVIPVEGSKDLYKNRISYNTATDSYYENGDLSNRYLRKWKEGAYQWDNIETKIEYDWNKTYLARMPTPEKMNDDGEISWKFDYRTGGSERAREGYLINSLKIKFIFATFDDSAKVELFIKLLPTLKNPSPNWELIPDWKLIQLQSELDTGDNEGRYMGNGIKDLTNFVKDEYGFMLKARLSGGVSNDIIWQKTQLFRQEWSRLLARSLEVEGDNTFGLDVNVELRPDIIIDPLPELSESFVLNDESTSDFVIHYEPSTDDNQNVAPSIISDNESKEPKESKVFHVHSEVLSKRSDYFGALLDSRMIESQTRKLTLTDVDVSYDSLEIILNYLYTGTLPNINSYDGWLTLLHYSSRFLIPTLVQRCEEALKGYANDDNLDDLKTISLETGAEQLSLYCENYELPKIN